MTTLHRSYPKARRPHRCGSCDRPIAPGEQYHRWKGTSEDGLWSGVATLKECAECCARYGREGFADA
jgi:hypothetical protein